MAPTTRQATKTKVWEEVLDLVVPYVHSVDDRNSVSLVSRKFYEIDGITRKRVIVHTPYSNPSRLSKRFPFIESLTLKGPPSINIQITPWIEQLALKFRCLTELHIRRLVILDEDLKALATTRGKDLRCLKISWCLGFTTDGLMHVSEYCNQLRTLCLGNTCNIGVKDGIWFHELALNSTVLEKFSFKDTKNICDAEDVTLLAKNCRNSLISLKIGACHLNRLRDAFRYAVRLQHFGGDFRSEEGIWNSDELVGFQFPPNVRSLSLENLVVNAYSETRYSIVRPSLNHIRKLKLNVLSLDVECHCLLFERCPNLEVLSTNDACGDRGLQVIGKFCKKLRKLTHNREVTHVGLISLAKGCTDLESLDVILEGISNETTERVGTHLKNLRKFSMNLSEEHGTTNLPLDNGIRAMLMGCRNLERLHIWDEGLTDVGLEYIGKYGANLRSLSLTHIKNSNALVKLSEGCPRLRKLKLNCSPSRKQAVASSVFKIPSLRYVSGYTPTSFELTRPEFQL